MGCRRLAERAWRWPPITELTVRYRAGFAYLDALLDNGDELPLCRLRDTGDPDRWGFALYTDNTGRYEDTILPTGRPAGTPRKLSTGPAACISAPRSQHTSHAGRTSPPRWTSGAEPILLADDRPPSSASPG